MELKEPIRDPDDDFFIEFLKDHYVMTIDGQYLFASKQAGRRPDRAFYMIPEGYRLGEGQNYFKKEIGKKIYEIALEYLQDVKAIAQHRIQGEEDYETGLDIVTSVDNPHSAYMAWMGKQMTFPGKEGVEAKCFNYIIPEGLPESYKERIREFYPEYEEPLTLYDLTNMKKDSRMVLNLGVDYFGGAVKKPNLTMVWNRAEGDGHISYHAGCTSSRILKGLSGTGKTTLTVGPELEQDDAVICKVIKENSKVESVEIVGLEAASFAKSEGLNQKSPEWQGLMKSKADSGKIVLAMNIDCENVDFIVKKIGKHEAKIPVATGKIGSLQCTIYEKSRTTNGRFIFKFSELNPGWGKEKRKKYLKTEGLAFKRFDIVEPIFRVINPGMAVALDSGCESIITSAVAGKKPGTRIRSYAATDFMAREQIQQALLKLKVYGDMGLGFDGNLLFFICNSGYVGEFDVNGDRKAEKGEKIKVQDTKKLIYLVENRLIKKWLVNPIFGYLIPDPKELEMHGMKDFGKRFNLLNYYSAKEILDISKRDIKERTDHLKWVFSGQSDVEKLKDVIDVWQKITLPGEREVEEFYKLNYQ
ncbi:MAG: phosphoenolpyruvate carboxykinase [Candidatus Methanolliviera sp. GoM_oil]|nr:MAG: phosphoenolpyruvate carboxykinase [Candidatus Methanolliviera sp. GoM_oil]